jgi:hypothetical protein
LNISVVPLAPDIMGHVPLTGGIFGSLPVVVTGPLLLPEPELLLELPTPLPDPELLELPLGPPEELPLGLPPLLLLLLVLPLGELPLLLLVLEPLGSGGIFPPVLLPNDPPLPFEPCPLPGPESPHVGSWVGCEPQLTKTPATVVARANAPRCAA